MVVTELAPRARVAALSRKVRVLVAPLAKIAQSRSRSSPRSGATLDLPWLLNKLGSEDVTSLLVEGGGEVNASFLLQGLAHRVAFFYAPKVLGGRDSRPAVGGLGAASQAQALQLARLRWRRLGQDWLLTASIRSKRGG